MLWHPRSSGQKLKLFQLQTLILFLSCVQEIVSNKEHTRTAASVGAYINAIDRGSGTEPFRTSSLQFPVFETVTSLRNMFQKSFKSYQGKNRKV